MAVLKDAGNLFDQPGMTKKSAGTAQADRGGAANTFAARMAAAMAKQQAAALPATTQQDRLTASFSAAKTPANALTTGAFASPAADSYASRMAAASADTFRPAAAPVPGERSASDPGSIASKYAAAVNPEPTAAIEPPVGRRTIASMPAREVKKNPAISQFGLDNSVSSKYAALMYSPDYKELSAAGESKRGVFSGDDTYDYINNIGDARKTIRNSTAFSGTMMFYDRYKRYEYMLPNEMGVYNYLYATSGSQAANDFLSELKPALDQRGSEKMIRDARFLAADRPVEYSLLSVPVNAIGSIVGSGTLLAQAAKAAVTGENIDYHAPGITLGRIPGEIRSQVSGDIRDNTGAVPAFFYDIAMSTADSLALALFDKFGIQSAAGVASRIVLDSSAGLNAAYQLADNGASDGQAILGGFAAAVIEDFFERHSIHAFFSVLDDVGGIFVKGSFAQTLKNLGAAIGKNAYTNAEEEALTELFNIAYDIGVNNYAFGTASEWGSYAQELRGAGYTDSEINKKIAAEIGKRVGLAALGGALQGAAMGTAGAAVRDIVNIRSDANAVAGVNAGVNTDVGAGAGADVRHDTGGRRAQTAVPPAATAAAADAAASSAAGEAAQAYAAEGKTFAQTMAERNAAEGGGAAPSALTDFTHEELASQLGGILRGEDTTAGYRGRDIGEFEPEYIGENLTLRSARENNVDTSVAREISRISELFETPVEFVSDNDTSFRGMYDRGTGRIIINSKSEADFKTVCVHELVHRVENTASWTELRNAVFEMLGSQGVDESAVNRKLEAVTDRYKRAGVQEDFTIQDAEREIVADEVAAILASDDRIVDLYRRNATLAGRIREWFRQVKRELKAFFGSVAGDPLGYGRNVDYWVAKTERAFARAARQYSREMIRKGKSAGFGARDYDYSLSASQSAIDAANSVKNQFGCEIPADDLADRFDNLADTLRNDTAAYPAETKILCSDIAAACAVAPDYNSLVRAVSNASGIIYRAAVEAERTDVDAENAAYAERAAVQSADDSYIDKIQGRTVRQIAAELKRRYSSVITHDRMRDALAEFYMMVINGADEYTAYDYAGRLASEIIDSGSARTVVGDDTVAEARATIENAWVHIPESAASEMGDDWQAFRAASGMNLVDAKTGDTVKGHTVISADMLWQDLASTGTAFFAAEPPGAETDILFEIQRFYDQTVPVRYNPNVEFYSETGEPIGELSGDEIARIKNELTDEIISKTAEVMANSGEPRLRVAAAEARVRRANTAAAQAYAERDAAYADVDDRIAVERGEAYARANAAINETNARYMAAVTDYEAALRTSRGETAAQSERADLELAARIAEGRAGKRRTVEELRRGISVEDARSDLNRALGGLVGHYTEAGKWVDGFLRRSDVIALMPPEMSTMLTDVFDRLADAENQNLTEILSEMKFVLRQAHEYAGNDNGFSYNAVAAVDAVARDIGNRGYNQLGARDVRRLLSVVNAVREDAGKYVDNAQANKYKVKDWGAVETAMNDGTYVGKVIDIQRLRDAARAEYEQLRGTGAPSDVVAEARDRAKGLNSYLGELKRYIAARRYLRADVLLGNLGDAEDKRAGWRYDINTAERNFDDVFGTERGRLLAAEYLDPVHERAADSNRYINSLLDRVRELNIDMKPQGRNRASESAAIQFVGEHDWQIQASEKTGMHDGVEYRQWVNELDAFMRENPDFDYDDIRRKADVFREIYADIMNRLNTALVMGGYDAKYARKGYFPHFDEGSGNTLLSSAAALVGIDPKSDMLLPTTINGLTSMFRPGKAYFGHLNERLPGERRYTLDAVAGLERYLVGASRVIYQTENIRNLRALAHTIRDYATSDGISRQAETIKNSDMTDEEKTRSLDELWSHGKHQLANFVAWLDEYTNLLAGKKSKHDRSVEALVGREFYNFSRKLYRNIAANLVGANISTQLTNFVPITQAMTELGPGYIARGAARTAASMRTPDMVFDASAFLVNRRGVNNITVDLQTQINDILSKPVSWIDGFACGTVVRARYLYNLDHGLNTADALAEADRYAALTIADRSVGAQPVLFQASNPIAKLLLQFQLEAVNEIQIMRKDLPRRYIKEGVGRVVVAELLFALMAYLFNTLFESITGRRPFLDPIDAASKMTGAVTGWELPRNFILYADKLVREGRFPEADDFRAPEVGIKAVGKKAVDIADALPVVSSLSKMLGLELDNSGRYFTSSAVPNVMGAGLSISDFMSGKISVEDFGRDMYSTMLKPAASVVLPFGSAQLFKTIEGIEAAAKRGVYTGTSEKPRLKYPVYSDEQPLEYVRGALFGKSSFPTAGDWVHEGFPTLLDKPTAAYDALIEDGTAARKSYSVVRDLADIKKTEDDTAYTLQLRELMRSPFSDSERSIAFRSYIATKEDKEDLQAIENAGATSEEAFRILADVKIARSNVDKDAKEYVKKAAAREALRNAPGSDRVRVKAYEVLIDKDIGEEVAHVVDSGISFDVYMQTLNRFYELSAADKKDKKTTEDERFISDSRKLRGVVMTVGDDAAYKSFKNIVSPDDYAKMTAVVKAGGTVTDYLDVRDFYRGAEATETATKKEQVLDFINGLKLSAAAKDALYLIYYTESTIDSAPWRWSW